MPPPIYPPYAFKAKRAPRIALYSHDTCGLGHMRRNVLIAQALVHAMPGVDMLMITGARDASALPMPPGVDILTLPALYKAESGQYRPRHFSFDVHELIAFRSRTIRTALAEFNPDMFIVDNVPRGAMGELDRVLQYLRRRRPEVRCVLGLRDVLDHPDAVLQEWSRAANLDAIRDYYDAVWVYGDPAVYNAAEEYHFPSDVQARLTFTGYLDQRARLAWVDAEGAPSVASDQQFYLCVVGGGQDGAHLADLFTTSLEARNKNGLVVTGPFMPSAAQQMLAGRSARNARLQVLRYVPEPTVLYGQAERVVSMGGYNTVCELLSLEKRALVIPRVSPRREQWIRAERLRDLGLIDVLHPGEASSQAIGSWLDRAVDPLTGIHERIDMKGLRRIPRLVTGLLAQAGVTVFERKAPKEHERKTYATC